MATDATIHTIEVKHGRRIQNLLTAIFMCGPLAIFIAIISKEQQISSRSIALFVIGVLPVIIPLYFALDRRVQIRVNKAGIWTRWRGLIKWEEIEYIYSTITKSHDNNDTYKLYLFIRKNGREHKILYRGMSVNFRDVREVIAYYVQQHNISDHGHIRYKPQSM